MLNESKLLDLNPQLGLLNNLYQDTRNPFRDSTMSNYLRIAVEGVFERAKDKSLFSLDIERLSTTDELRFELSASRFNYLFGLNLDGVNRVLDLSQDTGGCAHFLSKHSQSVDAVKIDTDRTRLAISRCANSRNICHISEDLAKLTWPENHYDLIHCPALESLELDKQQQASLLKQLNSALTERGVLIVGARNTNSVDKLLNPYHASQRADSTYSSPYSALYQSNDEQEYQRKELLDCLAWSDFTAIDFYASFSIGDKIQNLFSEDYLTSNLNAINHFNRLGAIENPQINEYLFFKAVQQRKQRKFEMASRYLVVAGRSTKSTRKVYNIDFCHFAGNSRKPLFRTMTLRQRAAAHVDKTALYPEHSPSALSPPEGVPKLEQNLQQQPFQKGRLLIDDWYTAALNCNIGAFNQHVDKFNDWLEQQSSDIEWWSSSYDMLPFNLIVDARSEDRFLCIDPEWQVNQSDNELLSVDFILFRALFWFAFENRALLTAFAEKSDLNTIGLFVAHYMPSASDVSDLYPHAALEEAMQAQISSDFRAKSVEHALNQRFDAEQVQTASLAKDQHQCQLAWSNDNNEVELSEARFQIWSAAGAADGQDKAAKTELVFANFNVNPDYPILRIDPLESKGVFSISEVQFLNQEGQLLTSLDSSESVQQHAQLHNIEYDERSQQFISLNQDPYLLLDTRVFDDLDWSTLNSITITLGLADDASYAQALDTLSSALDTQHKVLSRQANRLNQYRSELEYNQIRLDDAIDHRTDLNDMLRSVEKEKNQKVQELNARLSNLNDQLVAQINRNEEMQHFLLMRPSTRIKRFASRLLSRLTGRAASSADEEEQAHQAEQARLAEVEAARKFTDDGIELGEYDLPIKDDLIGQNTEDYQQWIRENDLNEDEIKQAQQQIEKFQLKPTFSILVPVYNTDPDYLIPMIRSVQAQIYPHWQLCLVDDCSPKSYLRKILQHEAEQDSRIHIQLNDHNQGISLSTNDALGMATGEYVALLDHDDELSNDALFQNAKAINENPDLELIYSDEDKMDLEGNRLEPYFKPDFSPDLLHTNNYICHFTVIKKELIDEIGGFREGLDGSQDHDIILRSAMAAKAIHHIPRILYHWRKIPGSTAVVYDAKSYAWEAGRKAVENCLQKQESGVRVEFGSLKGTYRVFRDIVGEPLVSIIIPFKDKPDLLETCLGTILDRSTYTNFEIIGVSNNSEEDETTAKMAEFQEKDSRIKFIEKNIPFNFSALCNAGVENSNGDYVLLLNNDIEIQSPDWIERLLEHAQRDTIGAVSGKLLYPNGRIQHAGVVAGMVGAAGHPHKFFPDRHIGYHGRLHMVYNVSAVTGAMLMVSKEKYLQVGGLDEDKFAVAYNDIDFCLKLLDAGYLNVFTPHCRAIHYESISRGYEDTPEKLERLKSEQANFWSRWQDFLEAGDPYYNPNLSLDNERFSLNFRD